MQTVTAGYLTAITATTRQMSQKVVITFVDNRLIGVTTTVTASEADSGPAPKEVVVDGEKIIPAHYAWADEYDESDPSGRARMYPADDLYPLPDGLIWAGATLSDGTTRAVSPSEALTINYAGTTNIKTVSWAGDDWLGRPEDFVIDYYDGSWHTIVSVTGHASHEYTYELPAAVSATKLRITVSKVNLPKVSAKLSELEGGLILDVTSRVKAWEILKERATSPDASSPLGNSSSNSLKLELDNSDGIFYRSSGSTYAPYLKANRRIAVECGVVLAGGGTELLPQGTFYTIGWDADQDSPVCKVTAWDRSKLLKEDDWESSLVYQDYTISELVHLVGLAAGLSDTYMVIDDTTDIIPYAWFESASYWSHLVALATAEGGQVYFNELDQLVFENRAHMTGGSAAVTLADSDVVIGMAEGWDQNKMRNSVKVSAKPLLPDAVQEIYHTTEAISVPAGGTKSLRLFFSTSPCVNVTTPVITGGADISIDSWTAYAWGGYLVLANSGGAAEDATDISIDGQPLIEAGGFYEKAEDIVSILENERRTYSISSKYIQSNATALSMAADLLAVLLDPGDERGMTGRGRPELQLADRIHVHNARMSINADQWVTRIALTFNNNGLKMKGTIIEA